MWEIGRRSQFKKDYKREKKSSLDIDALKFVVDTLRKREVLPDKYCDHKLSTKWKGRRECHVQPDVCLVYKVEKENQRIILERLGSHSELFG